MLDTALYILVTALAVLCAAVLWIDGPGELADLALRVSPAALFGLVGGLVVGVGRG